MARQKIQTKITLPFIALFVAIMLILPAMILSIVDHKYDEQFSIETREWLETIIETNFINEPDQKVKKAYRAEVVRFDRDGNVLSSTINLPNSDLFNFSEISAEIADHRDFVLRNVSVNGDLYKAIYAPIDDGKIYCFLRSIDKLAIAKRHVIWLTILIAVSGIFLVVGLSFLIGRTLTNPIDKLVEFTRCVASGDLGGQCENRSKDEIGDLTTAFNQMTIELRQSRSDLIRVERLATAGKMSASFAHEIRNPLSSIRMMTQLLQKPNVETSRKDRSLKYILDEIERIDVIVKGLMDFAKPTQIDLAQHDLNKTIDEVIELMDANFTHHKIELIRNFADLPKLTFDRDKIKQSLMNILLNAMDAQPNGGRIFIETRSEKSGAEIVVIDEGIGISESDLKQIFEPFFTKKPQGTGLGLSNTKRIIEQHGGTIVIESVIDRGTTVSLKFPN